MAARVDESGISPIARIDTTCRSSPGPSCALSQRIGELMSSVKVDVRVLNNGLEVDTARARPVRLIRTDSAIEGIREMFGGVVYAGLVYPLWYGDYIELSDQAFTKESTPEFIELGDEIPYAMDVSDDRDSVGVQLSEGDWYVESNRWGHYVVFDAEEPDAEVIAGKLDDELGLVSWDASHRAADNSRRYNWFARLNLAPNLDKATVTERVREVLDTFTTESESRSPELKLIPESPRSVEELLRAEAEARSFGETLARDLAAQSSEIEYLQVTVSNLTTANADLQRELTRSGNRARTHQAQIEKLAADATAVTDSHQAERLLLTKHIAELQSSLTEITERLPSASAADKASAVLTLEVQAERVRATQSQLNCERAEDERDAAMQQWLATDEERAAIQRQLTEATAQLESRAEADVRLSNKVDALQAQLLEVSDLDKQLAVRKEARRGQGKRLSVQEFITDVLKGLEVAERDIETLLTYPNPAKTFRFLTMLANQEDVHSVAPRDHRGLGNYTGWWEIQNINTGHGGSADMGRIYYTRDGRGLRAVVHLKKNDEEQAQFLRVNLGRPGRSRARR